MADEPPRKRGRRPAAAAAPAVPASSPAACAEGEAPLAAAPAVAWLQLPESRPAVPACAHCGGAVGGAAAQLRMLRGRPAAAGVCCAGGCGELYCGQRCAAAAAARHAAVCVGPLEEGAPLVAFKRLGLEAGAHEDFELAARLLTAAGNSVAAHWAPATASRYAAPPLPRASVRPPAETLAHGWHHRPLWWELAPPVDGGDGGAAAGPEVDAEAAAWADGQREVAAEAWGLLRAALPQAVGAASAGGTAAELDGWGRLLGYVTAEKLHLSRASPLVAVAEALGAAGGPSDAAEQELAAEMVAAARVVMRSRQLEAEAETENEEEEQEEDQQAPEGEPFTSASRWARLGQLADGPLLLRVLADPAEFFPGVHQRMAPIRGTKHLQQSSNWSPVFASGQHLRRWPSARQPSPRRGLRTAATRIAPSSCSNPHPVAPAAAPAAAGRVVEKVYKAAARAA